MKRLEWKTVEKGDRLVTNAGGIREVLRVSNGKKGGRHVVIHKTYGKGLLRLNGGRASLFKLIKKEKDFTAANKAYIDYKKNLEAEEVKPPKIESRPAEEITVRFFISGITSEPIEAEFVVSAPVVKIN